jgi:hypothetical protein
MCVEDVWISDTSTESLITPYKRKEDPYMYFQVKLSFISLLANEILDHQKKGGTVNFYVGIGYNDQTLIWKKKILEQRL